MGKRIIQRGTGYEIPQSKSGKQAMTHEDRHALFHRELSDRHRKPGRPAKPKRCVVQLRVRQGGKVTSFYSCTIAIEPIDAMKRIQDAFSGSIIH